MSDAPQQGFKRINFFKGFLTTEKDWVRLPADWRAKVRPWPVRARFEDEAALERLLDDAFRL